MEVYIYIKMKPYVRQWLVNKFGDGQSDWKVKFPHQSLENAFLKARLLTPPEGYRAAKRGEDEVGILIPNSPYKPVNEYNYLTQLDKDAVRSMVESMFDVAFKREMREDIKAGSKIKDSLLAWMHRNGVSMSNYENLKQQINRMCMSYRKNGIELNPRKVFAKKTRKK